MRINVQWRNEGGADMALARAPLDLRGQSTVEKIRLVIIFRLSW